MKIETLRELTPEERLISENKKFKKELDKQLKRESKSSDSSSPINLPFGRRSTNSIMTEFLFTMEMTNNTKYSAEKRTSWKNYTMNVLLPELEIRIPSIVQEWKESGTDWKYLNKLYDEIPETAKIFLK